jgi:sugar lactone lactonase YvrE
VLEGGEVTDRIDTPDNTYACMLGGDGGATLFVLTCAGAHPDEVVGTATGALWTTTVDVPRDPLSLP